MVSPHTGKARKQGIVFIFHPTYCDAVDHDSIHHIISGRALQVMVEVARGERLLITAIYAPASEEENLHLTLYSPQR